MKQTPSISVVFGNNEGTFALTVRNAIEVMGHDDSWPFNADWDILDVSTGKVVITGSAWDDGWGGDVSVSSNDFETEKLFDGILKSCFYTDYKSLHVGYGIGTMVEFLAMRFCDGDRGFYQQKVFQKWIND